MSTAPYGDGPAGLRPGPDGVERSGTAPRVAGSRTAAAVRATVRDAARLVVKVGSSSLTTAAGGLDPDRLDRLVDALAARRGAGAQLVLVSSGAIAAGLAPLGL